MAGYVREANDTSKPLHVRAATLATRILGHDVFQDGNGRTAILAIYKLLDSAGYALSQPPFIVHARISPRENSSSEYEKEAVVLPGWIEKNMVVKSSPKAVKLQYAISGVSRLQGMRKNWDTIRKRKLGRKEWFAENEDDLTNQADFRRLNQYVRALKEFGKGGALNEILKAPIMEN